MLLRLVVRDQADARLGGRDGMENCCRPGWDSWREEPSSMQRVSLRKKGLVGRCGPDHTSKGLHVGIKGRTPGAKGRKGKGMEIELLPTIAQVLCFLILIFCMTIGAKS